MIKPFTPGWTASDVLGGAGAVRFAPQVDEDLGAADDEAGEAGAAADDDAAFKFAGEAYEPRRDHARYVPPHGRDDTLFAPESTVAKPNIDDLLRRCGPPGMHPRARGQRPPETCAGRRVSIVALQHICRGEGVDLSLSEGMLLPHARSISHLKRSLAPDRRRRSGAAPSAAAASMAAARNRGKVPAGPMPVTLTAAEALGRTPRDAASEPVKPTEAEAQFAEHRFVSPPWEYTFVRVPRMGFMTSYVLQRVRATAGSGGGRAAQPMPA